MPIYKYRAATKAGDVVENRIDAPNKYALLKKLKNMLILMEQELVLVLVQCLQLKE